MLRMTLIITFVATEVIGILFLLIGWWMAIEGELFSDEFVLAGVLFLIVGSFAYFRWARHWPELSQMAIKIRDAVASKTDHKL